MRFLNVGITHGSAAALARAAGEVRAAVPDVACSVVPEAVFKNAKALSYFLPSPFAVSRSSIKCPTSRNACFENRRSPFRRNPFRFGLA